MPQRPLRDFGIIDVLVALQHPCQLRDRGKPCLPDHFTDTGVEALHHAVGLRGSRLDQAVLDFMFSTSLVKGMFAGRFARSCGAETVGKFLAIIGQAFGNLKRRRLDHVLQKSLAERADLSWRTSR